MQLRCVLKYGERFDRGDEYSRMAESTTRRVYHTIARLVIDEYESEWLQTETERGTRAY